MGWGERIHPKCGQHNFTSLGPRMRRRKWAEHLHSSPSASLAEAGTPAEVQSHYNCTKMDCTSHSEPQSNQKTFLQICLEVYLTTKLRRKKKEKKNKPTPKNPTFFSQTNYHISYIMLFFLSMLLSFLLKSTDKKLLITYCFNVYCFAFTNYSRILFLNKRTRQHFYPLHFVENSKIIFLSF